MTEDGPKHCSATTRACRYSSGEHRTINGPSFTPLAQHRDAIAEASADGRIDSEEQIVLSKRITDSIFAPKQEQDYMDKRPKEFEAEDLPYNADDITSQDIESLRYFYNDAITTTKNLHTKIVATDKTLVQSLNRIYSLTPENFKKNLSDGKYSSMSQSSAEKSFEEERDAALSSYLAAKASNEDNAQAYSSATKDLQSRYARYTTTVAEEGKRMRLGNVPASSIADRNPKGLTKDKYNTTIDALKNDTSMPEKDKLKIIAKMRKRLASNAMGKYDIELSEQGLVRIFGSRDDSYKEDRVAEKANNKKTLARIEEFTKRLKTAPWDSKIDY